MIRTRAESQHHTYQMWQIHKFITQVKSQISIGNFLKHTRKVKKKYLANFGMHLKKYLHPWNTA